MADFFEPQQVNVKDIPYWAKQSWKLFWRRPLLFMTISAVYHILAKYTGKLESFSLLVTLLVCYIFTLILVYFASTVDQSRQMQLIPTFRMVRKQFVVLCLLSAIFLMIYATFAIIANLLDDHLVAINYTESVIFKALAWLWPGHLSLLVLITCVVITSLWFLPPILALNALTFEESRRLARTAEHINEWVIFVATYPPLLTMIILMTLTELSLVLSLIYLPFFAIYLYVSYRHVFLGRKDNYPVVEKSAETVTAEPLTN